MNNKYRDPVVLAQVSYLCEPHDRSASLIKKQHNGIQNLGAACYLSTQLQCLGQNPVFLDGIFSWRPVDATHKMNGVMEKLQTLLAQ